MAMAVPKISFITPGSLKYSSLTFLIAQNFFYGILLPISRQPNKKGERYYFPTGVLAVEVFKAMGSIGAIALLHFYGNNKRNKGQEQITGLSNDDDYQPLLEDTGDDMKEDLSPLKDQLISTTAFRMCWPALLYVAQNNLQQLSGAYLTATEFQIFSQLKLVSTALFSVLLLKTKLSYHQWASIAMLLIGTSMVQIQSRSNSALATKVSDKNYSFVGILAIIGACLCSGLAGVLIELQLKCKTNFWVTNFHLSIFSIIPATVPVFVDIVLRNGFDSFRHFSLVIWATIGLNVLGGFLVAMTLKYANNIWKGFAVCVSLLLTVLYQVAQGEVLMSATQGVGSILVILSLCYYSSIKSNPPQHGIDHPVSKVWSVEGKR